VLATFISGLAAALAALLIRLEILVEMMSIGKLHFHPSAYKQDFTYWEVICTLVKNNPFCAK